MRFEYTISLEVANESQSFDEVEGKIRESIFRAGAELAAQILKWQEEQWQSFHRGYRHKGRSESSFKTTFGEFRFNRLMVIHKGARFAPVDRYCGIEGKNRATPAFVKLCAESSSVTSFRKATREVEKITGVKQSALSTWRLTQTSGEATLSESKKMPSLLPGDYGAFSNIRGEKEESRCPVLCVELDETYCKSKLKTYTKNEVKLAVFYTKKIPISKRSKRFKLINKTVLVARANESVRSFLGRVAWVAKNIYGANQSTTMIIRGDGAAWIKGFKDHYYPKAFYFLDTWHLLRKIYQAYGEQGLAILSAYVHRRNPSLLIDAIVRHFVNESSESRRLAAELITYIRNNEDGLITPLLSRETRALHAGMFKYGSGVIERNIDLVIGERCKLKRMSWSVQGLDHILSLRENQINRQNNSPLLRKIA